MSLRVLGFLSFRQLHSRRVQTALAIVGIAGGIALHLSVQLINKSILSYFRQTIESVAGQATLFISAGEAGFDEKSVTQTVEKIPGVRFAIPVIEARAYVFTGPKSSESVLIMGVDLLKEKNVRTYKTTEEDVIEDPLEFFNQADSLIIPKNFAARLKVKAGDKFRMSTSMGSKEFTVRGLLEDSSLTKAFGGAIGIMDISAAQFTFGKEGKLDRLDIVVDNGRSYDEMSAKISQALGPGFIVERPQSRGERTERLVQSYQFMLDFISSLALIIGLILVYSMVSRFVSERRQEIGTYRALGATKGLILSGCVFQGMLQGLAGGLLGALFAVGLANQLLSFVAQSLAQNFDLLIEITQIQAPWPLYAKAVIEGAVVAGFAALVPAWRASQVPPIEALNVDPLKGESIGQVNRLLAAQAVCGALLLGFAGLALYRGWDRAHFAVNMTAQIALVLGCVLMVCCGCVLTVRRLVGILGWGRARLFRLGGENILRSPVQTSQNGAVIAVGLLILVLFQGTAASFKNSVFDWLNRDVYWDLLVASSGDFMAFRPQPLKASVGAEILAIPGVERPATGKLAGARLVKLQADGREVMLEAYDDPGSKAARDLLFKSRDSDIGRRVGELYDSDEILFLASEGFMFQSRRSIGETVEVPSPGGMIRGRIIGEVNDFNFAGGSLFMDRSKYEKAWKDPLVSAFAVKVAAGFDADQVRREIDSRLAKSRDLMIIKSSELRDMATREVDSGLAFLDTLKLAVMAIVLISLVNAFLVSVIQRKREIGMLRAVGTSRPQLAAILLSEYVGLGLICSLLTFILGIPATYLLVHYSVSAMLGWTLQFHFPWRGIFEITAAGLAVSALAALIPIYHASRIQITEALRYE